MAEMQDHRVPVTVLTGYLGAGKTTLLNRILSENHGKKFAVIVNEFGKIGIDNDLVVETDEEIFEMNNGCVCCTVRGDLIRILNGLMKRADGFDGILVETTGLADPAPVAQTFFTDDDVRAKTRLDAVITVADAKHLESNLEQSPEAKEQIAFADVILVNKTDLLDEAEVIDLEKKIYSLNAYAKLHRTVKSNVELEKILDRGAFDLDRILTIEPEFLTPEMDEHGHHHHSHEHDDEIRSVALSTDKEIDPEIFFPWINQIVMTMGQDILRLKGILSFKDDDDRYALQGVHMMIEGDSQRPWASGEKRESRIVFIGRNLDETALEAGLTACIA